MKTKTSSTPRATLKKVAATPNKLRTKTVAKSVAKKPAAKPVKAKTAKSIIKTTPVKTKSPTTPAKKRVATVKAGAKPKAATPAAEVGVKPVKKPSMKAAAALVSNPVSSIQEKDKGKKNKPAKKKREKVVRDSYSIPKSQFAQLKAMRTDLAKTGHIASKSELLRAGLALLFRQSTTAVKELIDAMTPAPRGKSTKK